MVWSHQTHHLAGCLTCTFYSCSEKRFSINNTPTPSACWWIRPLSGVSGPYDSEPPTYTITHAYTQTVQTHDHTFWVTSATSLLAGGNIAVSSPLLTWMSHCSTRIGSLLFKKLQIQVSGCFFSINGMSWNLAITRSQDWTEKKNKNKKINTLLHFL